MNAQVRFTDIFNISYTLNTNTKSSEDGNNLQMTRASVALQARDNYRIQVFGPTGVQQVNNSSTGHTALSKQIRGPLVGDALQQIVEVAAYAYINAPTYAAGQQFILTINGIDVIYTASGGDVTLEGATSLYRDPVLEYWAANLPSGFTGELARYPSRNVTRSDGRVFSYNALYIRRTATNTTFTYSVSAGYGARSVVTII
jgi:hypothetical protein